MAQTVSLGTAQSFGVLGASTVTNTGPAVIQGDLGVSPGTAITGFPPGSTTGTIHAADAVALQAQNDTTTAYNSLAGRACGTTLTGDLGGRTLTPGVYCFASSAQLTGILTLNAQGDPNAVFIFQIGSTLTTASSSSVVMINSARACNVFWQVGSSATLGSATAFAGNIIALASVTLNTAASLSGRALARTGAVTLDSNTVSVPVCAVTPSCPVITVSPATLPGGAVGTAYSQTISAAPAATYTFSVSAGTLPTGLALNASSGAITGTPTTAGQFTFTITATDTNGCTGFQAYSVLIAPAACPVVTLSPPTLPNAVAGTAYAQTVVASPAGTYTYTVSLGALPAGLTLNSTTGAITGTPTTASLVGFTITATAANGCAGSLAYTIRVLPAACPVVTLSPSVLPVAIVGTPYSQTISASPAGTYTFSVLTGALPPGLSLNASTGAITGTPTAQGSFDFTLAATNGSGCVGTLAFTVVVAAVGSGGIPTLSEWAMILLAMLLAFAGFAAMRRQGK